MINYILAQQKGKQLNVIHYDSRTLNEVQKNFDIEDRELYNVIFSCENIRPCISDVKAKVYKNHLRINPKL